MSILRFLKKQTWQNCGPISMTSAPMKSMVHSHKEVTKHRKLSYTQPDFKVQFTEQNMNLLKYAHELDQIKLENYYKDKYMGQLFKEVLNILELEKDDKNTYCLLVTQNENDKQSYQVLCKLIQ